MANRLNLDNKLREVLGSTNVYYQPPESIKLKYPCIVYELVDIPISTADDGLYVKSDRYTVTLISNKPDTDLKDKMLEELQPYCRMDRVYAYENLYHYVYTIYNQ